jgi:predicted GNAT superfamily acetyltransferase
MRRSLTSVDPASQAVSAAEDAARRAGVRIEKLDEIEAIHEASRLFNRVWSTPETQPLISSSTLRALSHSNNYVFAAYDGAEMIGAVVGFIGFHDGSLLLHSHMTGVSEKLQGRSVGFALKQHQRAWSLERGIGLVTWTFDPLVRRNAYFNITKLGASVTAYYTSFYGEMNDGINDKDETDRVLIEWDLESTRAAEASVRGLSEPNLIELERAGAQVALSIGDDGAPTERKPTGDTLLVGVPEDIVELRRQDEGLAHGWRLALRNVLGAALNTGYETVGMTRSGFYVLERES